MALTEEQFNRLPPEIRAATLEKRRMDEEAQRASEARALKNCQLGAVLVAGGAVVIECFSGPWWPMYLLIALVGGATGYWGVFQRYSLLGCAALVGG